MGLEEAKKKFDQIALTIQDAVPEGKEAEQYGAGTDQARVFGLVPEAVRTAAHEGAAGLTDDEVFACVNQLVARSGVRKSLNHVVCSYFSNPFWSELFKRANLSEAAKAKRSG